MFSGLWWEPSCAAPKLSAKSWPRSVPSTPTWILARPSFTSTRRTFESHTPPGTQAPGSTSPSWTAIKRHRSLASQFPSAWPRLREAFNCYEVQGWLWPQRHDCAAPKVIRVYSNLELLSLSCFVHFCLSEDKAGRCVWDDVTFLHYSSNSIQSNYVSPVKFEIVGWRSLLLFCFCK